MSSIGYNSSNTSQDAFGWGTGYGNGGSLSYGLGQGGQFSNQYSGQQAWGPQAAALQGLYGGLGYGLQGATGAQGGVNRGTRASYRGVSDAMRGLAGYDPQAQIAAQERSLRQGLNHLGAQQMSQIGANAVAAGAFGGSRQGVVEGAAIGELGRAYAESLGDITANANAQGIQSYAAMGQLAPGLQQLQMQRQQSFMSPYLAAAQGYGVGPTMQSFGVGQSGGWNSTFNMANQYNLSRNMNTNGSESSSSSTGFDFPLF